MKILFYTYNDIKNITKENYDYNFYIFGKIK